MIRNYVLQTLRQMKGAGGPTVDEIELAIRDRPSDLEQVEEAAWAMGVLQYAADRLVQERKRSGPLLLRAYGIPPYKRVSRQQLCEETGLTPNALNVSLHRARIRLRELIEAEIKPTVNTQKDFDDERGILVRRLLDAHPGLFDADDDFYVSIDGE